MKKNEINFQELNALLKVNDVGILGENSSMSFVTFQFPKVKYYNYGKNINTTQLITENEDKKNKEIINGILNEHSLIIVGDKINSNSQQSYGTYPTWTGEKYLINIKQYENIQNYYKNTGDDFWDDVILNDEGKELIKKFSGETIKNFIKNLEINNIKLDKEYSINFFDITKEDFNIETKLINKENYPKEFNSGKWKKPGANLVQLSFYGKNDHETYFKIKKIQEELYPKSVICGKNFIGTNGQDWNGKIFQKGGLSTCYLIPKEFVIKDKEKKMDFDFLKRF